MSGYVLTPRACVDLKAIWNYTADRWGIEQADRYLRQLKHAMETIASDPRKGHRCDHIRPGYCKYSVASHMLFFRLHNNGIVVIRVLHQRMDFERHL